MNLFNRLSSVLRIPYTLVLVCILILPPTLIGMTAQSFQTDGINAQVDIPDETSMPPITRFIYEYSRQILVASASLISIVAGVLLSRNITGALTKMIRAAGQIGAGDFSKRVQSEGPSEIKELANAFNTMADKLEENEAKRTELHKILEELAITDELTGAYNRRELNRLIDLELRRAKRFKRPLSMIVFDIDHFKLVNDSYGHLLGDQVLTWLTIIIASNTRTTNYIARYGGDEFVILLPETTAENAYLAAERLRKKVANSPFRIQDDQGKPDELQVTISLGVSELIEDIQTPNEFFSSADQALYKAKRSGRNQTQIAAGATLGVHI